MRVPNKDVLRRLYIYHFAYTSRYYYRYYQEPVIEGHYLVKRFSLSSSRKVNLDAGFEQCLVTERKLKAALQS